MRRVKSAPANLAEMQNRKGKSILIKSTKNTIMPLTICSNNKSQENCKTRLKTVDNLNLVRNIKFGLRQFNAFSGDFLQTHCKTEESILLSGIIEYLSDNIFKRDKLEQLQSYILVYIVRYIFNICLDGSIYKRIDSILSLDFISSFIN